MINRTIEESAEGEVGEGVGQVIDVLLEEDAEFEMSKERGEGGEGVVELSAEFEVGEAVALADTRRERVAEISAKD